mgnify:CR=1 FL=1
MGMFGRAICGAKAGAVAAAGVALSFFVLDLIQFQPLATQRRRVPMARGQLRRHRQPQGQVQGGDERRLWRWLGRRLIGRRLLAAAHGFVRLAKDGRVQDRWRVLAPR